MGVLCILCGRGNWCTFISIISFAWTSAAVSESQVGGYVWVGPRAIGNADLAVLATCVRDLPVPRVGKVVLIAFPVMLEKN